MVRADVISLVREAPEAHGVLDKAEETAREVYCTVRSVGMREFYEAKSAGIEPEIVFQLTNAEDYGGEKIALWKGERYRVVRTYTRSMGIEITCARATNDREAVTV